MLCDKTLSKSACLSKEKKISICVLWLIYQGPSLDLIALSCVAGSIQLYELVYTGIMLPSIGWKSVTGRYNAETEIQGL